MRSLHDVMDGFRSVEERVDRSIAPIADFFDGAGAGMKPLAAAVATFALIGLLRLVGEDFAALVTWYGGIATFAALTAFAIVRSERLRDAAFAASIALAIVVPFVFVIKAPGPLHLFYVVFMCCSGYALAGEVWAALENNPGLLAAMTAVMIGLMPVGVMAYAELYLTGNIGLNAMGGLVAASATRYALIDRRIAVRSP